MVLGELDPQYQGKSVILAYAGGDPPASFSALRLVVQVDVHGGRSVRDVSRIELAKPRKRAHRLTNVRLGSQADIVCAWRGVCSGPKSGHPMAVRKNSHYSTALSTVAALTSSAWVLDSLAFRVSGRRQR